MKKHYFRLIVISIIVLCFITYFHYQANSIFTWKMAFFEIEEIEELKVATYNIQIGKEKDGTININRTIENVTSIKC
ncbi:hypothetical protein KHA80_00365 [Anaerobacillus sp. HL2]|nr:hypothetical protein KHA80_00365 [Anaerobacillus sp. HL2]